MRTWGERDNGPIAAGFLDYAELGFLARMNADLVEPRDDAALLELLARNLALAKELQIELRARAAARAPGVADAISASTDHLAAVFATLGLDSR